MCGYVKRHKIFYIKIKCPNMSFKAPIVWADAYKYSMTSSAKLVKMHNVNKDKISNINLPSDAPSPKGEGTHCFLWTFSSEQTHRKFYNALTLF